MTKKAENFEPGDLVQLKSGGPVMSVDKAGVGSEGEQCDCQWFGGKKLEHGRFHANTLKRATATEEK